MEKEMEKGQNITIVAVKNMQAFIKMEKEMEKEKNIMIKIPILMKSYVKNI